MQTGEVGVTPSPWMPRRGKKRRQSGCDAGEQGAQAYRLLQFQIREQREHRWRTEFGLRMRRISCLHRCEGKKRVDAPPEKEPSPLTMVQGKRPATTRISFVPL